MLYCNTRSISPRQVLARVLPFPEQCCGSLPQVSKVDLIVLILELRVPVVPLHPIKKGCRDYKGKSGQSSPQLKNPIIDSRRRLAHG